MPGRKGLQKARSCQLEVQETKQVLRQATQEREAAARELETLRLRRELCVGGVRQALEQVDTGAKELLDLSSQLEQRINQTNQALVQSWLVRADELQGLT